MASAEIFGQIKVWDVASGKVLRSIDRSTTPMRVEAMVFLPDGKTLVYADRQHNLWMEDALSGRKRYRLQGHTDSIWSLALTPDGSTLVSGSTDGTFKVWDLKTLP